MSTRQRLIILSVLVAICLGALALSVAPLSVSRETDTPISPSTEISAHLIVGSLNDTHTIPGGTTALAFLLSEADEHDLAVRTKEYPGMGTLVEKIGADENGTDGKYWMYYVNGAFAEISADQYVVKKGDTIEWKFEVPQQY